MPRAARPAPKRARAATTRAFLFSDLRDYTTYVETRGDREAAKLLRDYRSLIRREVARFDGAEVKTEGDSFYVVFESASAALDCAVAIARKVAAHNEKEPARPLKVGMGIHAGETIAFDQQFVGSAVNVASRLASQAQGGDIIVSGTFRGLVRTGRSYPMTLLGPLTLKGVSEPIDAWNVTAIESAPPVRETVLPPTPAPHAPPATGQVLCPVLIGRDDELAKIDAALEAATRGAGQTVVVAGEAGGGKSAFVREIETRAHGRGFRVLRGATLESDRTLPYAPFIAAVRSGFRGTPHERLGRVLAQTAPDLAQLFPELGRAAKPEGAMEQHRLSVAFHGLFTAFARESPILVVLEDLHWSDEASLDLLHYLARELRDSRTVVLANYRSDEMHRRHPFLRTLGSLQRERLVTEIPLRRLTPDEVGRLIQETFSTGPVSDEFRDAVYTRCEGNPFFTEELLKAMVDSGDIYRTASGWERKPIAELRIPSSIREAVHARIERLSPEAQATLSAASVIGLRFPFEVLRATTGASATDILAHLRQFIELQLAIEQGGDDDAYAFRHALTREVVYDELLAPERKALHRAVAAALESSPPVEPGLLALHLVAAGEHARAIPHLLEAAQRASAAGAPREAAAHYENALELGIPDADVATTLEALAEAYLHFDAKHARRAANGALERCRTTGDRLGMARALTFLARIAGLLAEPTQEYRDEARRVLEDLGDTPELARILIATGNNHVGAGRMGAAREAARAALGIAERLDDPALIAGALAIEGALVSEEDPRAALAVLERARGLALAAGVVPVTVQAYFVSTIALVFADASPAEVLAMIHEGLEHARKHGMEASSLVPAEAYYELNRGEWDAAEAAAARITQEDYRDNALEIRARIAEGRVGRERAAALFAEQAEAWRTLAGSAASIPALQTTAYAALLRGDEAAARAALADLRRADADQVFRVTDARLIVCTALLGERDDMARYAAASRDRDARWARPWQTAWTAAEQFVSGDAARCGATLSALVTDRGQWIPFGLDTAFVDVVVAYARALRARGVTLGPEWDAALSGARVFAERAKATAWLRELEDAARR